MCILMGMLVTDVAVRRIHWDWVAIKRWAFVGIAAVQGFTTTRKIDARPTLAALRKVHDQTWRGRPAHVSIMPEDQAWARRPRHENKPIGQSSLNSLKAAKQRALEEIRLREQQK